MKREESNVLYYVFVYRSTIVFVAVCVVIVVCLFVCFVLLLLFFVVVVVLFGGCCFFFVVVFFLSFFFFFFLFPCFFGSCFRSYSLRILEKKILNEDNYLIHTRASSSFKRP